MRRSDHPSRPSAMTCCFFASFKTFPTGRRVSPRVRVNVLGGGLSLAGFEVATYGRFWVTPEGHETEMCDRSSVRIPGSQAGLACHPSTRRVSAAVRQARARLSKRTIGVCFRKLTC